MSVSATLDTREYSSEGREIVCKIKNKYWENLGKQLQDSSIWGNFGERIIATYPSLSFKVRAIRLRAKNENKDSLSLPNPDWWLMQRLADYKRFKQLKNV